MAALHDLIYGPEVPHVNSNKAMVTKTARKVSYVSLFVLFSCLQNTQKSVSLKYVKGMTERHIE